jgi:aryl-alcohol dehydrogenase-like predicted oxidoreductase
MKYTKLGHSGTVVSELAFGTMCIGDDTPEHQAIAVLDAFVQTGGNLVDTADVYLGGKAEAVV